VEVSHFAGSVVGVCLLLVSQGVSRRLDAAFYAAAAGLGAGILASLLRGGFEETAFLALTLLALAASRGRFDRRAAFFETRFSTSWIVAVLSAVGAAVWLGLFSYKHVEYSNDLWWQFEVKKEVSRFLRGSVGAAVALLTFGVARLMRPAPPEVTLPTDADLADAGRALEHQESASALLVYLRDKALLWDDDRSGFVMYGVQGRTWAALGDPVAPPGSAPGLVRAFIEKADDFDGDAVFYEVTRSALHLYADFGLTLVKVGEHATVDLAGFGLEGAARKPLRNAVTRVVREGGRLRVLGPDEVSAVLDELDDVSRQWLDERRGGEKGFSLGFFDRAYVSRFPVTVLEHEGRIEAFATLWPGPSGAELGVDLMRSRPSAPKNAMEALFVEAMRWGRDQGFRRFALGMAPLSGFETSPVAPLWMRLGRFLYSHGEALYKFQGLRAFKEKFHPEWQPRYLAYPGGLGLPRILADVAALISGGYRRIFAK
jgi:phosphatidylglycerol lysyltransferase